VLPRVVIPRFTLRQSAGEAPRWAADARPPRSLHESPEGALSRLTAASAGAARHRAAREPPRGTLTEVRRRPQRRLPRGQQDPAGAGFGSSIDQVMEAETIETPPPLAERLRRLDHSVCSWAHWRTKMIHIGNSPLGRMAWRFHGRSAARSPLSTLDLFHSTDAARAAFRRCRAAFRRL
jgi:hypothetical protein